MAVAPPSYDVNERARQLAALRYGTPLAQTERERTTSGVNHDAAIRAIEGWRTGGIGGINAAYDILDQNLAQNVTNSQADLEDARQQVAGIWDRTNEETKVMRDDALAYFNDLAARVGVPQMAQASSNLGNVSRIQQLAQEALENNSRYGASRKTSLEGQGQLHMQMLNRGQQYAQSDRANRLGQFESEIAGGLLKAQGSKLDKDYDLGGRLLDLLTEQGAYTSVEAGNQQDKQFQQLSAYNQALLQEAELELRRSIAQAQLDDAAASRSAAASRAAADDSLAREKFAWEKEKYGKEMTAAERKAAEELRRWEAGHGLQVQQMLGETQDYGSGFQAAELAARQQNMDPADFRWAQAQMEAALGGMEGNWDQDDLRAAIQDRVITQGNQEYLRGLEGAGINGDVLSRLGPASMSHLKAEYNPYTNPALSAVIDAYFNGIRVPKYGY